MIWKVTWSKSTKQGYYTMKSSLESRKEGINVKLPNGFGSVYKLSGNRRNPWCARKTVGWTFDEEKEKSYPIYAFIGYYSNRKDALTALSEYNQDPYDLHHDTITFAEVFEKWSEDHFPKVSESNCKGYRASFKTCEALHDMKMVEIKLDHLQKVVDESGKNTPTLKKMKIMFGLMWDYCVKHEILPKDKRDIIRYVDISKAGNPNKIDRSPFTTKEINKLWSVVETNERFQIPLFLIYTGIRIGELYNLKKEDVHLQERWFQITHSKTESGIREVPIAEKIVPFLQNWMQKEGSEFVFPTSTGSKHCDRNFRDSWWNPMMEELQMNHRPHDTRHTCVSLLTTAGVDDRIIKKIVGHKGFSVTEAVYTHLELPVKLEAINKI